MKRSFLKFLKKSAKSITRLGERQFNFTFKNGIEIYYSCGRKFPKKIETGRIYIIRIFSKNSNKFIILEKNKCPIYLNQKEATIALNSLVKTGILLIEAPSISDDTENSFYLDWGLIPHYLKTFAIYQKKNKFERYYLNGKNRGFEILLSLKEKAGNGKFINIIKVKNGYLIKTKLINLPHKVFTEEEILYFITQINNLSTKFIEKEDTQKIIQKIKRGQNKKKYSSIQLDVYTEELRSIEEDINRTSSFIQTKFKNEKEKTKIN